MTDDKRTLPLAISSRALDRAVRHTRSMWLPINSVNLKRIHKHLDTGAYEDNRERLLKDICRDSHLFTFCLKELCQMVGPEAVRDPLETIRSAELATLTEILCVDARSASTHTLNTASELQVSRLEEGLVACAATQVFGEHLAIDPDTAGAAAVFHQLGLTLICWNYPGLYESCAAEISSERSLELILTERLGFSPATLAAATFGVESLPEYGAALTGALTAAATLARANQPEVYPTAAADWESAKEVIISTLGPSGLDRIAKHFTALSAPLVDVAPSLFQAGFLLDPEVRIAEAASAKTRRTNPFLPKCRRYLSDRLEAVYRDLDPSQPTPHVARTLLKQIVPAAGFHAATVFTVDPLTATLVPQLALSDHRLHEPRSATEIRLLNTALKSDTPLIGTPGSAGDHGPVDADETLIAQSLGLSSRFGVLLLAIKPGLLAQDRNQHIIHIRALALALTHTLTRS